MEVERTPRRSGRNEVERALCPVTWNHSTSGAAQRGILYLPSHSDAYCMIQEYIGEAEEPKKKRSPRKRAARKST
ncbi:MAG: hypothetical protein PHH09_06205 [Methanoregulaceae archaeon]|nr:hypothetical protein [Methanoregulaceae archaeon]